MASPGKRRETDLMKLMMADYEIQMADGDRVGEFFVKFHGPKSTPYEGGVWKVHVELPEAYPYKSPSIGFINRLYHPNVDEMSGSVCLDVINQSWSPMYDLTNIFEVFLPQLLTYPNPTDPLNGEAAALQMREPERYRAKVREYVQKYAKPEDFPAGSKPGAVDAPAGSARAPRARPSARNDVDDDDDDVHDNDDDDDDDVDVDDDDADSNFSMSDDDLAHDDDDECAAPSAHAQSAALDVPAPAPRDAGNGAPRPWQP